MKRKFIFLVMLFALLGGVNWNVLNAQQTIEIGSGTTATSRKIPFDVYFYASISQQIYLSDQIGTAGTITEISFNRYSGTNKARDMEIYMVETTKTQFDNINDWVALTQADRVFDGSLPYNGTSSGWFTITLDTPFEYSGEKNLVICVNIENISYVYDNANYFYAFDTDNSMALYRAVDESTNDPTSITREGTLHNKQNQIRFTMLPPAEPGVRVNTESIALGTTMLGTYWNEKETPSASFEAKATKTTITSISCDNDFFKLSYDMTANPVVVNVTYNKDANVSGLQEGTITISAEGVEDVTVAVSATAYAPVTPDVIELKQEVEFTAGAYENTPNFATLHDDYILPGEATEGSTPDAVYHFTMENEGTLTVNVTGTNAIAAVYKAEDMEDSGPMANNNFKGVVTGPSAPTTFGPCTFEEGTIEENGWTTKDVDGDGNNWFITEFLGTKLLKSDSYTSTDLYPENYLITAQKYLITESSKLIFDASSHNASYLDGVKILVSEDGESFNEEVTDVTINTVQYLSQVTIDLSSYQGREVYIAINHYTDAKWSLYVDNIQLTDGSTRSRSAEPQINAVQYPAGEYYLVAAAEDAFTVTIETGALPAPEAITEMLPADEAMEQDNPKLQWVFGKYTSEYQLLLGTTNPPKTVAVDWTSELASSFQTAGLEKNTRYYWQVKARNTIDVTATKVFSFVTPLDVPQNVAVSASTIVEGETVTVTWDAIENVTYNVYVDDVQVNDEPITATSYELAGLAYNVTTGRNVTVTANHTLGESPKSAAVNVKVAGYFTVTVTVTDGTNPIEGANVTLKGGDEWAEDELGNSLQYYTLEAITDANGIAVIENVRLLQPSGSGYSYYVVSAQYGVYADVTSYIRNYDEVANGQNYTIEFSMELQSPESITTDKENYLVGDDVVLTWEPIAAAVGYNVYKADDENPLNPELLTSPTFTIEDAEYGMYLQYAVTAVYEGLGESAKTTTTVSVTGMSEVLGTVTDGTNPIKGAKVVLLGYDEFYNDKTYTFTTDANGVFTGEVMVGYYTATATRYDFEDYTSNEQVVVNYNETANVNIAMTSYPSATIAVTATEVDGNAVVNWTAEYEKYNVYRRNVETDAIEKLATETTSKQYTDEQWASLENGTYQYGVSALSGGRTVLYEEDFEQGDSWTHNYPNSPYRWKLSSEQKVSGNNSIQLYHTLGSELERTYTSPEISIGEATATLKFKYLFKAYMGVYHTIIINVKGSNDVGWFKIYEIPKETLEEFREIEIPLAGNYNGDNIQIQFKGITGYYSAIWVDDISIETEAPGVESQITWSNELVKRTALTFNNAAGDNDWSNEANWDGGVLPTAEDNVVVNAVANITGTVAVNNLTIKANLNLKNGAAFTVNGTITLQPGYLYIEDGAQIFQSNEGVNALYRMSIKNPEEWGNNNKSGWQFISSPLLNSDITVFATEHNDDYTQSGLGYDLYKYDGSQDAEWVNYKANAFALESGLGYMYSHQARTIVTLNQGTLNPATTNTWELTYAEDNEPANLHLLGNPFTFNMDWSEVTVEDVYNGYATLNADGDNYVYATSGTINVGDGFFVQAIGSEPAMSYGMRGSKEKSANINVIARGNTGEDNVIINFAGEGEGFRKLQGFNEDNAKIFVSNDGVRYGIANVDEDVAEVELSFVAAQMGNYSISFDINGKFETVTLVDRFTGVETNMMLEDEYTFTATSNDSHNRFVVRLGSAKVDNANFVYQSGDELIIDAEGAIEIIDMMGRVVYSSEMNDGRVNVSNFNNAAYVVRALNEGKVQKVVIY